MADNSWSGEHLLVPTNFGPSSRAARQAALRFAAASRARLTLLHVAPSPPSAAGLDALGLLRDAGQGHTANLRSRHALRADWADVHPEFHSAVELRTEWRQGELVAELVRFVRDENVDAIVLGARRWRWPFRASLAERLAAQTTCAVMLVYAAGWQPWRPWPANRTAVSTRLSVDTPSA